METELHAASDSHAPRRIGTVLADARATSGLSLVDIARDTRVPVRHLQAIEGDAHDSLPALPYTIGFVKSFARAVGLDAEATAAQFRAETSKTAHVPAAAAMEPLDERRLPPRGLLTFSVVGVVAIVGVVVAYSAGMFDGATPSEPVAVAAAPVLAPPTLAPAPLPDATTAPAVGAAPPDPAVVAAANPGPLATTAPPAGGAVAITAVEDAWFRVSGWDPAANRVVTVKTGVLAKGERYDVPPTPGLKLWTGRAGALQVSVGGRALPPLGGPVQTVKNVSLNPADLIARVAPAPVAATGVTPQ